MSSDIYPGKNPWKNSLQLLCALLLLSMAASALAQTEPKVDPFYMQLMKDGVRAHERAAHGEAVRILKLACFGFLDEPQILVQGLGHLAIAQAALGDQEGVRETYRRLEDLEDRFQAYSRAPLKPELRRQLGDLLPRYVSKTTLSASPTFRKLVEPAVAPGPSLSGDVTVTAEPLPGDQEERLQEARTLLRKARTAGDLVEPLTIARKVADAHPDSNEAQHLAAEIAYRASLWQEAAKYFRRGGDPGDDKPTLLFFMAVSLYESGDRSDAVTLLRRSLPRLQRTQYVDSYADKILGETANGDS